MALRQRRRAILLPSSALLPADVAAYLTQSAGRQPWQFTPEASRRARGVELWAAFRSLGRSGLREMIERNCRLARLFVERLNHGAARTGVLGEPINAASLPEPRQHCRALVCNRTVGQIMRYPATHSRTM